MYELVTARYCSAYAHILEPLDGTKKWTGKDHDGDSISIFMTERGGKFYFFVQTRDKDTNDVDMEVISETIVIKNPKHSDMCVVCVELPEDVPFRCTTYQIPATSRRPAFDWQEFFGQRGIVGKDVTPDSEKLSRSPMKYTLYRIGFTSPSPAAPAPAVSAAPTPAAPMDVDAEPTRERAPLFTEMEKLRKIEHEFDLALQEFHTASRDVNNAISKHDDDTVHDMFEILTVRCSAVGRKHKSMLKAMEEMKAILHTHLVRSDLCRSQYNSYIVCPGSV